MVFMNSVSSEALLSIFNPRILTGSISIDSPSSFPRISSTPSLSSFSSMMISGRATSRSMLTSASLTSALMPGTLTSISRATSFRSISPIATSSSGRVDRLISSPNSIVFSGTSTSYMSILTEEGTILGTYALNATTASGAVRASRSALTTIPGAAPTSPSTLNISVTA